MKDIIFLPWRDIHNFRKEGFRVREGNIIKNIAMREDVNKLLVINRAKNLKSIFTNKSSGMEVNKNLLPNKKLCCKFLGCKLYMIEEKLFSLELPDFLFNKGDNELEKYAVFQNFLFKIIKKASIFLDIDLNSQETWVWSSDLSRSFIFNKLNKKDMSCIKIFDTIDNLVQHKAYSEAQRIKNAERYEIVNKNTDVIFSVSESNLKILYKDNDNRVRKYHIQNGIDANRFENLKSITKHIKRSNEKLVCGYVGVIESRVDYNLLKEIALKEKRIEFQLVGPVLEEGNADLDILKSLDNVKFTGPVSYDKVPEIIHNFDICIMPHVINTFTNSMSPLKFYEYLAANKPVIMTKVPPAEYVSNLNRVFIASTTDEWINAIKEASLVFDDELKKDIQRQNLIDKHSWGKLVDDMFNSILNEDTKEVSG
ncbi:glycosyltransferase [Priestia megaterium]|uniref:glycosyltransferase n=1 Tax=Priestia megaterium TaxID=1404 RepID=UPI00221EF356|nr:glycosyltransferase [Priestia megaterium]UYV54092.1 glycosyltransferase [Priestia megaterium]